MVVTKKDFFQGKLRMYLKKNLKMLDLTCSQYIFFSSLLTVFTWDVLASH